MLSYFTSVGKTYDVNDLFYLHREVDDKLVGVVLQWSQVTVVKWLLEEQVLVEFLFISEEGLASYRQDMWSGISSYISELRKPNHA